MKLYIFNWIGGGYNSVWADSLDAAIVEIGRKFGNSNLQVDLKTLHVGTMQELNQLDNAYSSLCA